MKTIIIIVLVIVAVVLVGTFPLTIIGTVFEYIGKGINWLAKILNFFGWNGMIG